ncbi:MAG: EpsI family protein [Armatimonadota bacterium]|nr:MAG: EpsI family protein [Armatimonadota bacterium]
MRAVDKRCIAMLVLLLAGQVAAWATRPMTGASAELPVERIPLRVGDWQGRDLGPYDDLTMDMLKPDAYLNREYVNADGLPVHFGVILGHRKATFHSPGFCLLGGGWNIVSKSQLTFQAATTGAAIPVNRFILAREGDHAVVLYYYVERDRATTSWVMHQAYLAWDRLRHERPVGALVRLTVPVASDTDAAARRGMRLLGVLHPHVVEVTGA